MQSRRSLHEDTFCLLSSAFTGARIEVMKTTALSPIHHDPGSQRMGLTHLAIALGSEKKLIELLPKFVQLGIPFWMNLVELVTVTMRVLFSILTEIDLNLRFN